MFQSDLIKASMENRKTLLQSEIIAKATIRLADGSYRFIVVHRESTRHEFYTIYKTNARTPRAPRKGWKPISFYGRDLIAAVKQYDDFRSFAAWYARINKAEIVTIRVMKTRRLAEMKTKTNHESTASDWTPRINSFNPRDYEKLNRRLDSKMSGRVISNEWRK